MPQQPIMRLAAEDGRLLDPEGSEPGDLRQAMRLSVGAVSVVTAGVGEARTGATVTTAHSLSTDPATMLVSINLNSSSFSVIERFGHYCVNFLHADQREVAERFSGAGGLKGGQRYAGSNWGALETGAGVLEGALASIDCEVAEIVPRHSHALILGTVRAVLVRPGPALVYRDGGYATFG